MKIIKPFGSYKRRANKIFVLLSYGYSLLFFFICSSSFGQIFIGGIGDGIASNRIVNNNCPTAFAIPIPYFGGIADGHGNSIDINNVCPTAFVIPIPYLGGIADGHGNSVDINNNCPTASVISIPYLGGIADGHGNSIDINNNCPTASVIPIPYFGGIADGHGNSIDINNNCPTASIIPIPYVGGIADGHGNGVIINNTDPNCNSILPIELLSFSGKCVNESIQILWATATESNNDYFTIERGTDGINWEVIGKINGVGNSYNTRYYEFIDNYSSNSQFSEAGFYYRLKQTDYNDKFEYSNLIFVVAGCKNSEKDLTIYPNPSQQMFSITASENISHITVYNMIGEKILEQRDINVSSAEINLSECANGMYMAEIIFGSARIQKKIVKQ